MAINDCPKPYYCYDYEAYPAQSGCDTKEYYLSGISSIGLLSCGAELVDPSDAEEVQALIDSGDLIIISGIKAGFDDASPITIDPVTACGTTITINADRTVSFEDAKVSKEVVEWYNTIKSQRFGGALLYECAENRVSYVTQYVTMTANRAGGNTNSEAQRIAGTIAWRSQDDPVPYDAPGTIFG
jgi:hypothetical protein